MEQILSQDEIDALLKGISEGEIETQKEVVEVAEDSKEEHEEKAKSLDFLQYTRSKKERLPALDFIYDRFSKSFRSALSLFVEREVEVNLEPMQYVAYGDFYRHAPLANQHECCRH